MKLVIVHEAEPLDRHTCDGRCVWREGRHCVLFVATLVALPNTAATDLRARRARQCKQAEKRADRLDGFISARQLAREGQIVTETTISEKGKI